MRAERAARLWTQKDIDACAIAWRAGESATEIAKAINRSRNSVVAKMHRLRIPTPASPFPDGLPKYDYESGHRMARRRRVAKQRAEKQRAERAAKVKSTTQPDWRLLMPRQPRLVVLPDNPGFVRPQPWHPARDAKPAWLVRA